MSEVALRNDSEVVEINQLTAEQIELMKRTVAKGATAHTACGIVTFKVEYLILLNGRCNSSYRLRYCNAS